VAATAVGGGGGGGGGTMTAARRRGLEWPRVARSVPPPWPPRLPPPPPRGQPPFVPRATPVPRRCAAASATTAAAPAGEGLPGSGATGAERPRAAADGARKVHVQANRAICFISWWLASHHAARRRCPRLSRGDLAACTRAPRAIPPQEKHKKKNSGRSLARPTRANAASSQPSRRPGDARHPCTFLHQPNPPGPVPATPTAHATQTRPSP